MIRRHLRVIITIDGVLPLIPCGTRDLLVSMVLPFGRGWTTAVATYLERVAVLGGELAVGAAELVDVGVRLGVAVEHRLVVAAVRALVALVRPRAVVAAQVVLEVVTQLGGERTSRTLEHLVGGHVLLPAMYPQLLLQPPPPSSTSSSSPPSPCGSTKTRQQRRIYNRGAPCGLRGL